MPLHRAVVPINLEGRVTGLRDGTATAAGFSGQKLDHVRDLATEWVKDGVHPAIVALVARRGVIAFHEAFGRLGPEPDDPPLPRDALFPIASLGKPVTATALMTLVEEGRVGLTPPHVGLTPRRSPHTRLASISSILATISRTRNGRPCTLLRPMQSTRHCARSNQRS